MSPPAREAIRSERATSTADGFGSLRAAALLSVLVLVASYVQVLRSVTDVVGGTGTLALVVAVALVAGTLVARLVPVRVASVLGAGVFLAGLALYVSSVPDGLELLFSSGTVVRDVAALLTGMSVLRMVEAGTWAISFVPAPTFLSWYLVLRRRYAAGAGVGLLALSMVILTGDAELSIALLGALGAAGAVGFGELDRRGASPGQSDVLAVVLSLMLVATLSVTVVPGGASTSLAPADGLQSLDGSLVGTGDQVTIVGSIELSPDVRFTVESDEPAYWRTDAYDRYTGSTWLQSGEASAYDGPLDPPPGETETIEQRVEAETELATMPAAWRPVRVDGAADARVSDHGGLQPDEPLETGDRYVVESERPDPSPEELREAGTDYPGDVEERYTQLPKDTPDRVGEYTASLTEDADTPYERALIVERHLSSEWAYTLDVERPEGDVADATLFELEAAYCTYFATTMVAMLRSQEVPARFVTGYTEGEEVGEDRYAVRGLDAHAWVEVYFPGTGWVEFDPTPSSRDQVHENGGRSDDASEADEPSADPAETECPAGERRDGADEGPTGGSEPGSDAGAEADDRAGAPDAEEPSADRSDSPDDPAGETGPVAGTSDTPERPEIDDDAAISPVEPSRELFAVLGALVVGLGAGVHRSGATDRLVAAFGRRRGGEAPEQRVERAYARLERRLESRHRERRAGESVRGYVEELSVVGVDERVGRVARLYERARYGPGVSEEEADEALRLVEELRGERSLRERLRS